MALFQLCLFFCLIFFYFLCLFLCLIFFFILCHCFCLIFFYFSSPFFCLIFFSLFLKSLILSYCLPSDMVCLWLIVSYFLCLCFSLILFIFLYFYHRLIIVMPPLKGRDSALNISWNTDDGSKPTILEVNDKVSNQTNTTDGNKPTILEVKDKLSNQTNTTDSIGTSTGTANKFASAEQVQSCIKHFWILGNWIWMLEFLSWKKTPPVIMIGFFFLYLWLSICETSWITKSDIFLCEGYSAHLVYRSVEL